MGSYRPPTLKKIALDLQDEFPKLSDFEALTIAVQVQRNQIIKDAFGVTDSDSSPRFMEGIAMAISGKL